MFSNNNNRPILRTRWNYAISEGFGLDAYLKTRSYRNTTAYRPEYFARPAGRGLPGLVFAVRGGEAFVLRASTDAGQQRIDGTSDPIWRAALGAGSRRKSAVQWFVGVEASTTAPPVLGPRGSGTATAPSRVRISMPA